MLNIQYRQTNFYKESLTRVFKSPKQFWNEMKTIIITSDKHDIVKIGVANKILYDPASIAQAFNQHFSSGCSI